MRKYNALCAALAFLMVLIAVYFGSSIHNANENQLITHLNEMDHIYHYDIAMVPGLNYQAALLTLPLILIVLGVELFIAFRSRIRQVRNIAVGLALAMGIVAIVAVLTVAAPHSYDFSVWGYIWITMGLFAIAGNVLSIFVKGNKSSDLKKV